MLKSALLVCLASSPIPAIATEFDSTEPVVKVNISGERVTVDVELLLPATAQQVWSVWTDYDHYTRFVPSLKISHILNQQGNLVHIYQRGFSQHGPISFPFESENQDEQIMPYQEIHSRQLKGSLKSLAASTRFVTDSEGTRVLYHAESIPGIWMPPILTKLFIEHETIAHYRLMRSEVMRRQKNELSLDHSTSFNTN